MRVISSKQVFEAFKFFRGPTYSLGGYHFSYVDIFCGSAPPSSVSISYSGEGDFFPSHSSSAIFCYSSTTFTASHTSWDLAAAALFLHFSNNYAICSFSSSIFLCMADFSTSTSKLARACHSGGHDSRMVNMTSSIAR